MYANAIGTTCCVLLLLGPPSLCAGAFVNRKQPAPSSPSELHEPLPGSKGALPYTMAYTPRMK